MIHWPGVQLRALNNNQIPSEPWAHQKTDKSCCYTRQQGHAAGAASPLVPAVFLHRAPVRIARCTSLVVLCSAEKDLRKYEIRSGSANSEKEKTTRLDAGPLAA